MSKFRNICEKEFVKRKELDFEFTLTNISWLKAWWCWILKQFYFYIQLLSFKRIAGSSSERYRLLISDGMYSNSYAMLATQLNKMVTDSTLDEFCVIKVKRLQCNTMQGKKVIIILDMEVLRPGSQVRTFWLIMVLLLFFHTFNMKTKKMCYVSQRTLITNVTQILSFGIFFLLGQIIFQSEKNY